MSSAGASVRPRPPPSTDHPVEIPGTRSVGSGTYSSTAVTHPELELDLHGARPSLPSWVGGEEDARDTEVSDLKPPLEQARRRDASVHAVLIRADGTNAGEPHHLGKLPLTVGRHRDNGLRIDDPGVSRFHARIDCDEEGHFVEDLHSQNGTFVVGERTARTYLTSGDLVRFGPRVSLRYMALDVEQEDLLRQLYDSSTKDALTGAHNRRHFDETLRGEVAFAQRHRTALSLILLDLDHFKAVNDRYGHRAGDAVLKQVCRLVRERLRTEDVFARFGGEEFAVILRGVDSKGAARLGERLRATVSALPVVFDGLAIGVTVSIGCAALAEVAPCTGDALLEVADRRLYSAKGAGRNRVVSSE